MDLHDGDETGIQVVCLRLFGVEHLHWVGTPWDGEDGRFVEVLRELDGIKCGRSHNEFHVRAFLHRLKEREEKGVCVSLTL